MGVYASRCSGCSDYCRAAGGCGGYWQNGDQLARSDLALELYIGLIRRGWLSFGECTSGLTS